MTDEPKAMRPVDYSRVESIIIDPPHPDYRYVPAMDPRPRDHPEPPPPFATVEHVNCRCVLVEDARTAIVEHEPYVAHRVAMSALGDRMHRDAVLASIYGEDIHLAADWGARTAEEIYADVKRLHDSLARPPRPAIHDQLPPWAAEWPVTTAIRWDVDLRTARHGPWGGETRYGGPYRGKATVFGAPAPLSKRARRRARGKAKS